MVTAGTRRATRPLRRGTATVRGGFTLVETILVLALLVIIGAVAWPQLHGAFASRRLRAAADQLRADFTRARVAAMESGRAHALAVDPITGRYAVSPLDDLSDSDPFSLPAAGGLQPAPVLDGALPEEIKLLSLTAADDAQPPPSVGGMPLVPGAAPGTSGTMPPGAFSVVYFHPDGTTSSAVATLAGESEMFIEVRLRGLTGGTSVGEVFVGEANAVAGGVAESPYSGATP